MGVFSLYIINRAGSLLFCQDYMQIPILSGNERLNLAGLLHGLSTIAGNLSPAEDQSGIHEIETSGFRLEMFQPVTGMQFVAVCDVKQGSLQHFLRSCHRLYADYVLKDPFYNVDMLIRCDKFTTNVQAAVDALNNKA
eukprot:m.138702 g.138702  ORF g.138702 m.138702 type:complete len:138 (-) comp16373_c0_seq1:184-597(-)